MNKRSVFIALLIGFYILFFVMFIRYSKTKNNENLDSPDTDECNENSPCVRMCTNKMAQIIANGTSINFEVKNPLTNASSIINILNGSPCEKTKILETSDWKFSPVGKFI